MTPSERVGSSKHHSILMVCLERELERREAKELEIKLEDHDRLEIELDAAHTVRYLLN